MLASDEAADAGDMGLCAALWGFSDVDFGWAVLESDGAILINGRASFYGTHAEGQRLEIESDLNSFEM